MFRKYLSLAAAVCSLAAAPTFAQTNELSIHWEELTAADFVLALEQSRQTCMLPFGVIEKHGPTGPLGTDLLNGRYLAQLAAEQEYTIIFPAYYFGQISEARHQPGTLAYPAQLQLELLQATVDEMARNGCKKVIIQNAHGGNNNLLRYFAQAQMDTAHDYVVYAYFRDRDVELPAAALPSGPGVDGHGGEGEMSRVMAHSPELVHPERAPQQSGASQERLSNLPGSVYTGIWWYANQPHHYQGDAAGATAERGAAETEVQARGLAEAIRAIKEDNNAAALQQRFYEESANPVLTAQ